MFQRYTPEGQRRGGGGDEQGSRFLYNFITCSCASARE